MGFGIEMPLKRLTRNEVKIRKGLPKLKRPLHPLAGGEGRVRAAGVPGCRATHLTLPRLRRGPLPLPPLKGGEGLAGRISVDSSCTPSQFILSQALTSGG